MDSGHLGPIGLGHYRLSKDPAIHVSSVRYYMAVAMILWYQADLREKHKRVWD